MEDTGDRFENQTRCELQWPELLGVQLAVVALSGACLGALRLRGRRV